MINQARINQAGEASGDKDFRPIYSIYVAIGQKQIKRGAAGHQCFGGSRRDAIHDHRRGDRFGFRDESVSRAVCRGFDGRMVC